MKSRIRSTDSRGETIIEVLIAIAVISLVLGTSYVIANRSLRLGIEARERGEALRLIEGQIEAMKFEKESVSTPAEQATFNSLYKNSAQDYCVVVANPNAANLTADRRLAGSGACTLDVFGKSGTPGARYNLQIHYVSASECATGPCPHESVMRFTATWERFSGRITENEKTSIYYRL